MTALFSRNRKTYLIGGRRRMDVPSPDSLWRLARRWDVASQDPDKWWCRYPELPFTTKGMHRSAARSGAYQKVVRDYLRCGATIDDNIGKLLKALDDMGIADNTIVVYVSDQGYF